MNFSLLALEQRVLEIIYHEFQRELCANLDPVNNIGGSELSPNPAPPNQLPLTSSLQSASPDQPPPDLALFLPLYRRAFLI